MNWQTWFFVSVLIFATGSVVGQEREADRGQRETVARGEETARRQGESTARQDATRETEAVPEETSRRERIAERIRRAGRLPRTTEEAREAGVPEERVRETIRVIRERGIPADEAQEIIEIDTEEVRRGGNPDNFGAFVQQMKDGGLRGRELAEAIHAEQVARGMKKPKAEASPGHSKGRGGKPRHDDEDDEEDDDDRKREARGKGKGKR